MATSDEDLEAYEGEDSKEDSENSEDVMLIEEERVDSGDKVVEDSEGVSHVLEGTADRVSTIGEG